MTIDKKATQQDEEVQTLRRFIENKGEIFKPDLALYHGIHPEVKEPCDISYNGVEYQITYGDRDKLRNLRETTSRSKIYADIIGLSEKDYAKTLLEKALKSKQDKSDSKMTLLIDCTYTSWGSLSERETICRTYFKDNEQKLGGSWQNIFIIFPDGNVQLY